MKKIEIPGFGDLEIKNILLDLNGTINFYGKRPANIKKYIKLLKEDLNLYIVSANTRGDLKDISEDIGVDGLQLDRTIAEDDAKLKILNELDPKSTIMIGNGNNDAKALKKACIGIAVVGSEGASSKAIFNADLVVNTSIDALKLILDAKALTATLRT